MFRSSRARSKPNSESREAFARKFRRSAWGVRSWRRGKPRRFLIGKFKRLSGHSSAPKPEAKKICSKPPMRSLRTRAPRPFMRGLHIVCASISCVADADLPPKDLPENLKCREPPHSKKLLRNLQTGQTCSPDKLAKRAGLQTVRACGTDKKVLCKNPGLAPEKYSAGGGFLDGSRRQSSRARKRAQNPFRRNIFFKKNSAHSLRPPQISAERLRLRSAQTWKRPF